MTRRAAIAALAAFAAFSQARGEWVTEVVTQEVSAASYVTNGLIAMFDITSCDGAIWRNLGTEGSDVSVVGKYDSIDTLGIALNSSCVSSNITSQTSTAPITIQSMARMVSLSVASDSPYVNFANRAAMTWDARSQLSQWTRDSRGYWCFLQHRTSSVSEAQTMQMAYKSRTAICVYSATPANSSMYENTTKLALTDEWDKGSATALGTTLSIGVSDSKTYLSCVRIYNRALTASEIASNYAIDKWRFIEGRGNSPMMFTNRVYRAPAPMRSFDAAHPFNAPTARTRLGGTGSGEDGTTLRPSAHIAIKRNEED